ncbi:MAG: hypothetical protein ACTSRU_09020 [Candidatus Hodarchaeales archaeon]
MKDKTLSLILWGLIGAFFGSMIGGIAGAGLGLLICVLGADLLIGPTEDTEIQKEEK